MTREERNARRRERRRLGNLPAVVVYADIRGPSSKEAATIGLHSVTERKARSLSHGPEIRVSLPYVGWLAR